MPAATASEFFAAYPEFANYDAEQVDSWLQEIEAIYCPATVWTEPVRQRRAVMLRLAHSMETHLQQQAASASMGSAISKGQGFSIGSAGTPLEQTVYGQEFKELRRTLPTSTSFAF